MAGKKHSKSVTNVRLTKLIGKFLNNEIIFLLDAKGSIVDIDLAPSLSQVKVKIDFINNDDAAKYLPILKINARSIRLKMAKRLNLRQTPVIHFIKLADTDEVVEVIKILNRV